MRRTWFRAAWFAGDGIAVTFRFGKEHFSAGFRAIRALSQ
jgi:hypothetical protein